MILIVLYGCETWSHTLKEEHGLRLFENRVLSRIFRPKTEEETRGWRRLHNEELHNFYASPNVIRAVKSMRMRWVAMQHVWGDKKRIQYFCRKPEGKRPLGRPRRRWEDIRIDLKNRLGGCGMDSHDSEWGPVANINTVMNLRTIS
jgi:hypothetical protein